MMPDGSLRLVRPATLTGLIEDVCHTDKWVGRGKSQKRERCICNESTARLLLDNHRFLDALPPITVVVPCPVLMDRDGELSEISAYDRQSGVLPMGSPCSGWS